jgi:nicotinamide riboside kinase
MSGSARCIALVGAESTGKTTLARGLAEALRARTGQRVAWVPEVLRQWCDANGRTPLAHEQAPIMRAQHERIGEAATSHDWVVCDTTALMTAVYSRQVFGDRTLDERAATLHRRHISLTLLTALDLPWVSDGLQREGPQVREPVDAALRELMLREGIAFGVVGGTGDERLTRALAAVQPLLGAGDPADASRRGLFTGLDAARSGRERWACECCLPEQEQALKRLRS